MQQIAQGPGAALYHSLQDAETLVGCPLWPAFSAVADGSNGERLGASKITLSYWGAVRLIT